MKHLLPLLLTLFSLSAQADNITLADPTIFFDDGLYYLTGTLDGNGFRMYRSADLVHWTATGNAAGGLALHKDDVFGTASFWAPQIVKHDGRYYIAYAANEQIGIAVADHPAGPYTSATKREISHSTGQIDPFIFVDDDGKAYMYYVRFTGGNELWVAEMNDDWTDVKTNTLTRCLGADDNTWEHRRNYSDVKVTEGPTVIKHGGYYFLLYSANDFRDIDYAVGYAYSTSPRGPWTKVGRPFLSRHNTGINGSGHGDLFQDADGQWYYVFHVHASNSSVGTRRTAIIPITLTDDPKNKFLPETSRLFLLTDNAASSATVPTAATRFEADGISYEVLNSKNVQVSFHHPVLFGGYEGHVEVPETVEHDGQTYTVNSLGLSAFYNCPGLESVALPTTVRKFDTSAFESCGVRFVDIPQAVTSLGYRCFADNSNLLDVIVNRSAPATMSPGTFSATTLQNGKLWVPDGATATYQGHQRWGEFANISGAEPASKKYDFLSDGLFFVIASDTTCEVSCEGAAGASYRGPVIVTPEAVEHDGHRYTVTAVANSAFRDCRLVEKIVVGEGATRFGQYAASGCYQLSEVTLPSTMQTMGTSCFRYCSLITDVYCYAPVPPTASTKNIFHSAAYSGTLHVPAGTRQAYAAATAWKEFAHIIEIDDTALPTLRPATPASTTLYDLQGRPVTTPQPGLYISNGRKVLYIHASSLEKSSFPSFP